MSVERHWLATYMVHYRVRQRVNRLDRVASALARESNPTAVEQFLASVMHQFGGPDAFAREWKARYDAVCQKNPASRRAGNMLGAIGRIAEACQAPRDQMLATAQELDRETKERLLEHVAANPDAVIYAAFWATMSLDPAAGSAVVSDAIDWQGADLWLVAW